MPGIRDNEAWEARVQAMERSADICERIAAQRMRENHALLVEMNGGEEPVLTYQTDEDVRRIQAQRELAEIEREEYELAMRRQKLRNMAEGTR